MHVHLLWAHPLAESFSSALKGTVLEALSRRGHEVDLCDLYAEAFEPAMGEHARRRYHDVPDNLADISGYVERVRSAEALVFVFPTWNFGPPAILKGWLDRVMVPGVAFELRGSTIRPNLRHIRRIAFVTTYGAKRWTVRWLVGDPNRLIMLRGIARLCHPRCRAQWLACHDMNHAEPARLDAFRGQVAEAFTAW